MNGSSPILSPRIATRAQRFALAAVLVLAGLAGPVAADDLGNVAATRGGDPTSEPRQAGQRLSTRLPVTGGGILRIELDHGSVNVVSHDAAEVRLEARARGVGASGFSFGVEREGRDLVLRGRAEAWLEWLAGLPRVEVQAWIPSSFAVEIETTGGSVEVASVSGVVIRNSAGSIRVRDISGQVDARTSEPTISGLAGCQPIGRAAANMAGLGRIDIAEVAGSVRAITGGARIQLVGVGGNVEAHASGGEIAIDGVSGQVVADTRGAAILARFTRAPAGRLQTRGGWIEITFPAGVDANLDALARGGCVYFDRDPRAGCGAAPGPVVGPINRGGPALKLRTENGDIHLRTL